MTSAADVSRYVDELDELTAAQGSNGRFGDEHKQWRSRVATIILRAQDDARTKALGHAAVEDVHGNAPLCERCGTANFTIRRRCRDCGHDLVQHPDQDIDAEVRWDAEDGRRATVAARSAARGK